VLLREGRYFIEAMRRLGFRTASAVGFSSLQSRWQSDDKNAPKKEEDKGAVGKTVKEEPKQPKAEEPKPETPTPTKPGADPTTEQPKVSSKEDTPPPQPPPPPPPLQDPAETNEQMQRAQKQLEEGLSKVNSMLHTMPQEYQVGAACCVFLLALWYVLSSSRRSIKRQCESTEAQTKEALEQFTTELNSLKNRWESDMNTREAQVRLLQEQNAQQTKSIDQLTAALKQCAPRFADSANQQ
jgi:hypothetical protein